MAAGPMVSGTITGTETVTLALDAIAKGVSELPDTKRAITNLVVGTARGLAPQRSGRLAGSIGGSVTADGVQLGSGQPYAGAMEWGWSARGIRGAHYLNSAVYGNAAQIVTLYEQGLIRVVADAQAGGA